MTEQQMPKFMGVLVEHQRAFFSDFGDEDAQWVIQNTKAAIAVFAQAVKSRGVKAIGEIKNVLANLKKITINPTLEKRTADCFTNTERYYHRDSNLNTLLPEIQPAQEAVEVAVNKLLENSRFVGMVQSLLGTTDTGTTVLSREIIARKYIFFLPQIEQLIDRQESGENVGLRVDGWGNFFLVLNKKGGVSVVCVCRRGGRWSVGVYDLGNVYVWGAGRHFFSCN